MGSQVRLTAEEQEVLERIRKRLLQEGFRITNERLLLALIKAIAQLPEDQLVSRIKEGLEGMDPGRD